LRDANDSGNRLPHAQIAHCTALTLNIQFDGLDNAVQCTIWGFVSVGRTTTYTA